MWEWSLPEVSLVLFNEDRQKDSKESHQISWSHPAIIRTAYTTLTGIHATKVKSKEIQK
jgi:hypothetical protein